MKRFEVKAEDFDGVYAECDSREEAENIIAEAKEIDKVHAFYRRYWVIDKTDVGNATK